ncbi:hypothetical protein Tco_0800787 [Tanacetum coccineum]|uniref:Uncharacterized protein n=1 Tax=Tanacetum coccineum TaxID=301880 RepID=A0ABQ4ZU62_9ASTR
MGADGVERGWGLLALGVSMYWLLLLLLYLCAQALTKDRNMVRTSCDAEEEISKQPNSTTTGTQLHPTGEIHRKYEPDETLSRIVYYDDSTVMKRKDRWTEKDLDSIQLELPLLTSIPSIMVKDQDPRSFSLLVLLINYVLTKPLADLEELEKTWMPTMMMEWVISTLEDRFVEKHVSRQDGLME